jgi:DNA-binding GntR family transcriptional regulator
VDILTATSELALARRSLPQAIYLALREKILTGGYQLGEALRQESLAKEFEASRVPVREALNRLEAEGLVILRPRRGFVVASLDIAEVAEIFDLRMVLEEHAGGVATKTRTPEDVAEVKKILDVLEVIDIDDPTNIAKWAAYNRMFHSRLFESSRRKHLCNIANTLRDKVERYVRVEVSMTGHLDRAQAEHRKIFKAFADGDAARVSRLSREHCESTADRLIGALKAREKNSAKQKSAKQK